MPRTGYTLLEVLAVAVLIALIAGAGMPAVVRLVHGDPLAADGARLVRTERALRTAARGEGIVLEPASDGWRARLGGADRGLRLEGCQVQWSDGERPLDRLAIDREGRSVDCTITLRRGSRVARWSLAGLTGEWRREDPP